LLLPAEWSLGPPAGLAAAGLWVGAMAGALVLSTALTMLLQITLFWTISGKGVQVFATSLATLLGGLVIPLPLFPDWAQPILRALPFAGLMDLPGRVYTGHLAGADALAGIAG